MSGAPIILKGRVRPHARYLEAEARQKRIADLIAQEQTVMDAPPHQLFACVGCGHVESARDLLRGAVRSANLALDRGHLAAARPPRCRRCHGTVFKAEAPS